MTGGEVVDRVIPALRSSWNSVRISEGTALCGRAASRSMSSLCVRPFEDMPK